MSGFDAILSHPASRATAWALLHFLWQGTAVALVLAGLLALLPRRLAQIRFAAAALALLTMLVLPVVTAVAIATGGRPGADPGSLSGTLRTAATPVLTALRDLSPTPAADAAGGSVATTASWLRFVVVIWLAGVVLLSVRNLGSWLGVRRLTRSGTFPVPDAWHAVLRDLCRRLRVSRPVRLFGSHRVSVPTVVGWLRPAVLVPASVLTGLRPDELEAILAHELGHVRRHDYLLNLIQTFVETLLFYHPAVWWVSRQIRVERENACDDMAAACCGDARRVAVALARMETLRATTPAFAMGADGSPLLSRIARLAGVPVTRPRGDRGLPGTLVLMALLALGGGFFALQARPSSAELATRAGSMRGPALAIAGEETFQVAGALAGAATTESAEATESTEPVLAQNHSSRHWSVKRDADWSSGEGKWNADYRDGHFSFEVRAGGSRWGESGNVEEYGFSRREVEDILAEDPISFRIPKEAGTFLFEGEADSRGQDIRAHGGFTFEPDPDYVGKMKAIGYDAGEVRDRQMELAAHSVDTDFVRELNDLGYRELALDRLIEFRIHGVTGAYVRGMRDSGYAKLPPARLVEFRIHGIDPEYVRGMAESGFANLSPERIVEFKIHGIDPEYVRGLATSGYHDLPPARLVEFRIHGIDPEYLSGLAASGYGDLPPERVVEFRIHGIGPEYVEGLGALGYPNLDPKKVVEMKVHGVTPDSVRRLQERGLTDLTPGEIIDIHIRGLDRVLRERGSH